jgi:hypothetical protein
VDIDDPDILSGSSPERTEGVRVPPPDQPAAEGAEALALAEPLPDSPAPASPAADPSPASPAADPSPSGSTPPSGAPVADSRARRIRGLVVTGLAWALVLGTLLVPNSIAAVSVVAFLRIPIELLLAVAVIVVCPPRPRRYAAILFGIVLGAMTLVKFLDMGFIAILQRPFDPILDWVLIGDGVSFLDDAVGRAATVGVEIAAGVLVVAVPVLTVLAVLRLSRVVARHRTGATRSLAVLGIVWTVCAALGVQLVPKVPVASQTETALAYRHAAAARTSLHDERVFAGSVGVDPFGDTPGSGLLTGLRGDDVMLTFVESYGLIAVQDAGVDKALDAGTTELAAAGFSARSGWLTSPTTTGGSWLAHSTLMSGLWINTEERYAALMARDRLTLPSAFGKAGWRTVGVEPGVTKAWPEGAFYGYDKVYQDNNLGYQGPKFGWATMPDQYVLSNFARTEYDKPGRAPLMAELTLVSSHSPWAPIPTYLNWGQVGNGTVYNGVKAKAESVSEVWKDNDRVRAAYIQSVEYTLQTLISFVKTYGKNNLVLVFLGDHQPAPVVAGDHAPWQVPVTIVAHDQSVLDRMADWGWEPGLRPDAKAPLWRMDAFRDKFLSAFGSTGS